MSTKPDKSGSGAAWGIFSALFTVLLFAAGAWVLLNRQYVIDQLTVWQYEPAVDVVALVDDSGMAEEGRFYFYASTPKLIADQKTYNASCPRQEEGSAILGCYASGKIYVYDVPDERLASVPPVTAAHEMLHAVYERMDSDEKAQVNKLLEVEYKKLLSTNDAKFRERMEYYARTEPGERDNELHSIIGTEIHAVSEELEAHYSQYFDDRQKVVTLHGSYNDQFVALEQSSTSLRSQLERLSEEINTMTNQYNADIQVLNTDIENFNSQAANGVFSSEESFNSARGELVVRVDALEQTRQSIDAKHAEYEQKRLAYNETVDESNSLSRSLDSTLAPAPSI